MNKNLQSINLDSPKIKWEGAVSVERTGEYHMPWRIPYKLYDYFERTASHEYIVEVYKTIKFFYFRLFFVRNKIKTMLGKFMVPEVDISSLSIIKQTKGWQIIRNNIPENEFSTKELQKFLNDHVIFNLLNEPLPDKEEQSLTQTEILEKLKEEEKQFEQLRIKAPIGFHPELGTLYIYPFSTPKQYVLITQLGLFSFICNSAQTLDSPADNEFIVELSLTQSALNYSLLGDLNSAAKQIEYVKEKGFQKQTLKLLLENSKKRGKISNQTP